MNIKTLTGSGRKIGIFTLPFIIAGVILNLRFPAFCEIGGPGPILKVISALLLGLGLVSWTWTVILILTRVPRGELITTGPFSIVKHPLYTTVALLIIPFTGILFNTWVFIPVGLVLYIASRVFSPEEERMVEGMFGDEWHQYLKGVTIKWL